MTQGQVFCPGCKQHVFAVVQLAVAGNALDGGSGATSKVRKCSQCRAVLPEDAMPEAAPNTTPETAMPTAAAVIPDQPPPLPARPKVAQIRQRPQPRAVTHASPVPTPPMFGAMPDYEAMMREELAVLEARCEYLRGFIAQFERGAAGSPAEDAAAAE